MADEREFSVVAERSPVRRRSPAILTDKSLTGEQIVGKRATPETQNSLSSTTTPS